MFALLKSRLSRFRRDEEGSIIAETVIMFPTLFAAVLATFVFFDAFRNQAINLKANYTISDSFSRQSELITDNFMTNSWYLHRFLTGSKELTRMRVSIVQYYDDDKSYTVVWSRSKGGGVDFDYGELSSIGLTAADIPVMPDLERLVVVQTSVDYEPRFSIGLGAFTFDNVIFTRPRIGQGLCYSQHGSNAAGQRVCPIGS